MARKKEKTDKHGYKADHWVLIRVQSHLLDDQILGTYGLFRSKQSKDAGESPVDTVDIRIPIGGLEAVTPGVRAALEAAFIAPGAPLEGSTNTPD